VAASNVIGFVVARIHDCHHTSPKAGINGIVDRSLIPAAFWDNEAIRLSSVPFASDATTRSLERPI
jgi:hypothetical protein